MKNIFSSLYFRVMHLSGHTHAPRYLAGLGFIEAIFFPIPVDVLLMPMALSKPDNAWRFALTATVFSALGGIVGYLLGVFFADYILSLFDFLGWSETYQTVVSWFWRWGVWIIFLAGFTPLPYKVFTLTAGMFLMPFLPFVIASVVGRAMRYYGVTWLTCRFGKRVETVLIRYMDRIGWALLLICFLAWLVRLYVT